MDHQFENADEWSLNPNAVYYCKSKHQAHLLIKGFSLLLLHN